MNRLHRSAKRPRCRRNLPSTGETRRAKHIRRERLEADPHCWFCGVRLGPQTSTLDHLVPRSRGGQTTRSNTVLACRACNDTKSNLPADLFVCRLIRGTGILRLWEVPSVLFSVTQEETETMSDCPTNVAGFNYDVLPPKIRERTQQQTQVIHGLLKRTTEGLIEIGRRLVEVKAILDDPQKFDAWALAEFQFTRSTASQLMRITEKFGDLDCLDNFQHSALAELVKKRVDQRAVKTAIAEARKGRMVTARRVVELAHQFAETPEQTIKPKALYTLRSAIQSLSENMEILANSTDLVELNELTDELLSLVMQLRNACRAGLAEAEAANGKRNRRRRRSAGNRSAGSSPAGRQTAAVIS